MIPACLYLRSSKDRSDVSIDAQRRELQALAKARGMTVSAEFSDVVESGKDEFREGFQSLLRELQAPSRAWSAILVLDTSRIGRRRYIAQMFARECEKKSVTVVFAKVPDVDPISRVILDSVLQAMDEVHSLMSREKGIAGMAENVRQGYRAGGAAPKGYKLKSVTTGAIRDGQAVAKSKLVVSDDAPMMQKYLQARARGTPMREAAAEAGLTLAETTLIGVEFNALVYSGATVWNVHAEQYKERDENGKVWLRYKGGAKRRPRADWIIQPDTHEALITRAEAETILSRRESLKQRQRYQTRSDYVLAGLLTTPAGQAWHGGAGYYRSPDRSVKMESVERAVLAQLLADLTSEPFVDAVVKRSHEEAEAVAKGGEYAAIDKQLADVNRRRARLAPRGGTHPPHGRIRFELPCPSLTG